jgi:uncharacterized protein YqjF (DUF2071 family)
VDEKRSVFLSAEWRKLAMANYIVDPAILKSYVPAKTELDLWNGNCYVSLVGFMFLNTAIKGFKIPFHKHFEEVNLRFYVRYKDGDEWKRGVVFIKEIVPKPMLSFVANTLYGENYVTMPMNHKWENISQQLKVSYAWKNKKWHSLELTCLDNAVDIMEGSEEEFITEHYWGYTKISETKTSEYAVEHPRWKVYPVQDYLINVSFGEVYGEWFKSLDSEVPRSVFLAEGSEIIVSGGRILL